MNRFFQAILPSGGGSFLEPLLQELLLLSTGHLMSKSKKKDSKKSKDTSDLLDTATLGLKKYRRFAKQVKKLSTAQKVVGGLALLAAGYAFVVNSSLGEDAAEAPAADEPDEPKALPAPHDSPGSGPSKSKRRKPSNSAKHSPFSDEHYEK